MADKIDNGGPAFPTVKSSLTRDHLREAGLFTQDYETIGGMSLRDWFAGQASPTVLGLIGVPKDGPDDLWDRSIAERCYAIADAMLEARGAKKDLALAPRAQLVLFL